VLRTQIKLKIDYECKRLLIYFVFAKTINVDENSAKHVISVDVNENNVAVKVLDKVYILETGIKKITIGYARYREIIQSVKAMDTLVELFTVGSVREREISD
jgi:putative transposase